MRHLALSLVLIFISALHTVRADSANPIRKVLQLIGDLQKKVISDGCKEQKSYEDYVKWCGKTSREKQFAIKEATSAKEGLEAASQKASDERDEAITQIQDLAGAIATDEADLKAATLLRQKENTDFKAFDEDLDSTIKTLTRAQQVLRKELSKAGIKASFLQRPTAGMKLFHTSLRQLVDAASAISSHDQRQLTALIQTADETTDLDEDREMAEFGGAEDQEELGAPKVAVYKSKSTPLLEALEQLQDKTAAAQADARKKEASSQHNFEMLAQSLKAKIATQNKELEASRKDKARAEETRSDTESKLAVTVKDLQADQTYLAKLQHGCMDRATTFEVAQKTRKTELEALAEAKKAIEEMTGGAEGQAYSFVQMRRSHAIVGFDTANGEVAYEQIKSLASRTNSLALTQLASRLQAAIRYAASEGRAGMGNPFGKIQGIIKSMIAKLEKEATEDANQKEFCDREMAHTKKSMAEKEDEVDDLAAKLETVGSQLANLKQALKTLSEEISDVVKSQAELDRIRSQEHAAFQQSRQDFQDGLAGVQVALKVLRQYYARDGDGSSLVQEDMQAKMTSASDAPASSGAGIIGLLEVIESDFAKALSELTEEENSSNEDYEEITQKNKVARATLEAEVKHKNEEITQLQKRATELQADSSDAEQELAAVNDYWEQLKPKCIKPPESYEERMAKRQAEIDGLTSALAALEGEEAASSS